MKTMKDPAIFLAQFAGDEAPFNSLPSIAAWAASLGYNHPGDRSSPRRFRDRRKG
jgi:hypothetical protein